MRVLSKGPKQVKTFMSLLFTRINVFGIFEARGPSWGGGGRIRGVGGGENKRGEGVGGGVGGQSRAIKLLYALSGPSRAIKLLYAPSPPPPQYGP